MKKDLTNIIFILDKSGSMGGLESDTIGGFNSMLNKQKRLNSEAIMSTVMFNHESDYVNKNVPIDNVQELTFKDYQTGGCTALLDAVGMTISDIEQFYNDLSEEEVPEKTIVVIITDGYENASQEYSVNQIKSLITQKEKQENWEFLFLGANIDVKSTARSYGLQASRATEFYNDSKGIQTNFESVSNVLSNVRSGNSISSDWKEEIEKVFNSKKKN